MDGLPQVSDENLTPTGPSNQVKQGGDGDSAADDLRLAQQARQGDEQAFVTLVDCSAKQIHSLMFRLANGDAEFAAELTQEAYARAWERLDQFSGGSRFSTWLYRLARNRALDVLAKKKPKAMEAPDLERAGPSKGDTDRIAKKELRDRVREALEALPPDLRELLVLKEYKGWDLQRLAEALECPVGTVKSRLHRARQALREQLQGNIVSEDIA